MVGAVSSGEVWNLLHGSSSTHGTSGLLCSGTVGHECCNHTGTDLGPTAGIARIGCRVPSYASAAMGLCGRVLG